MKNRVCLFFDRPYVDAHYCFREMVTHFLEKEWEVDLFIPFSLLHPVPFFGTFANENLKVFFVDSPHKGTLQFLGRALNRRDYRVIIATPQWALCCAALTGKILNVPVFCLSDEIFGSAQTEWSAAQRRLSRGQLKWKQREIWAHRQCALTIALHRSRFEQVQKINTLPEHHACAVIPNAPSGEARRLQSSFYHDTLNIPADQVILLHSGGFRWSLLNRLAEVSSLWTKDLTVVVQGRMKERAGYATNARLKITDHVLPSDMMRYATSSADIGLVLYDRNHPEEARNGATAGKLGLYLSCGLPVICCNLEVLKWVEEEGCGLWVDDVSQIPEAAKKIMTSYENYSKNARRIFDERYEYSKHFNQFFEELLKVVS